MEIPGTTRRPLAESPASDTKTQSIPSAPSNPTDSARLGAPTHTQQWSKDALLLTLVKLLETMPADQASSVLRGLAMKLHTAAERSEAVAPRVLAWAERFQAAAQSGDLSKLVPKLQPVAHFGIRAYQAARQVTVEQIDLTALLRDSGTSKAELAQRGLVAEAIGGGLGHPAARSDPSASIEALALALARRGAAADHLRRRIALAARRSRRRRRRRRWPRA